jgi:soluble lytic murein transglycosylase-like protein
MFRSLLAAAALCVLTPSLAQAQIYSWRDPAGRLIMSDQPHDGATKVYAVSTASSVSEFRVTKPASADKAALFDELIVQHASVHSLSPDFVRAVIQAESAFNPWARSSKGAMGLMQLIPSTARRFGVKNAFDPKANLDGGVRYLRYLMDLFGGDLKLSLAAYNAGENAVDRHNGIPPFRETRDYVRKISQLYSSAAAARRPASGIEKYVDEKGIVHFNNTDVH